MTEGESRSSVRGGTCTGKNKGGKNKGGKGEEMGSSKERRKRRKGMLLLT